MNIKRHIPNTVTLLNLLSGCFGAVEAVNGNITATFYFMLASLVFDFLDGFLARTLNSYSDVGKELDSLADMVSFGLNPALIMWSFGGEYSYIAFFIALMSALRLAKFNVDTRDHDVFYGLATPANAIFFASLGFISQTSPDSCIASLMGNEYLRIALIVSFSLLLVSDIPMFSLKFKSLSFKKNSTIYTFLILSLTGIICKGVTAIIFIVIAYVLLSIIQYLFRKK